MEDVVNGYILLAEKMQGLCLGGQAFNFSNAAPVTVKEVIKRISRLMSRPIKYRILNQAKCEIKKQYLSFQKARKILGWEARYSLDHGLQKTIAWYSGHLNPSLLRRRTAN